MESPLFPMDIAGQLDRARAVIERHLADTLVAIHLYGSALDGGLKRYSDIDLLVTVRARLPEPLRRDLMRDLLAVSVPVDSGGPWRALEVTVVALEDVVPWRHPARRELQFGEWLRQDLLAGVVEPPIPDHDLAILLTKARQHGVALSGPPAASLLDAVPPRDFRAALADTLAQWNTEEDWEGDERNILLVLARIWYSAATGQIAPKDVAATWTLERLPEPHRPALAAARAAYLEGEQEGPVDSERVAAFIGYARAEIASILAESALRDPE